jgi:2,4'-dihydroxyacetophenone dioxygenase
MPITAFNSFTDGLDPNRRSREHFIANINLDADRMWVPYASGVWLQPCCFNVTSGGFSVVLRCCARALPSLDRFAQVLRDAKRIFV